MKFRFVISLVGLAAQPLAASDAPVAPAIPVAMLVDVGSNRVLFERQPDLRFVPASLTKVMTAKVAFTLMDSGKLSLSQRYTVSPATAREWNGKGTSLHLHAGDALPVSTLLRGITTVSANDAAVVLATGYAGSIAGWTALMNAEAVRLGMASSHFGTPNGWPDHKATYVTARDLVTLGSALIREHPAHYASYFGQKWLSYDGVTQANRDPTIGVVEGADGIKTGFTHEAGYNFLGSAIRNGRRLMVVIAGAKSGDQRAQAAKGLLEWGFAEWHSQPLFQTGQSIITAKVQQGREREVPLVAAQPVVLTLAKDETGPVTLRATYRGPITAPIVQGQTVGRLEIMLGRKLAGTVPLLAGNAVSAAGPLDRLWNGLARLWP